MSSQALNLALWLPQTAPRSGESIVVQNANAPYTTAFAPAGGGSGGGAMTVSTTAPPTPNDGDFWMDTSGAHPDLKVFESSTGWVVLAQGMGLPAATAEGDLIIAGAGPAFDWTVSDTIDNGRF